MDHAQSGYALQQLWNCPRNSLINSARSLASAENKEGGRTHRRPLRNLEKSLSHRNSRHNRIAEILGGALEVDRGGRNKARYHSISKARNQVGLESDGWNVFED